MSSQSRDSLEALLEKWHLLPPSSVTFSREQWYLPLRRAKPFLSLYYPALKARTLYTWAHQQRLLSTLPPSFQRLFCAKQHHSHHLWYATYATQHLPPKVYFFIPARHLRDDLEQLAHAQHLLIRPPYGALIHHAQQVVEETFGTLDRAATLTLLRLLPELQTIPTRAIRKHSPLSS